MAAFPSKPRTILLIIDPQNDFHEGGSLAVTGADADSARLSKLLAENMHIIDHIYVTLDSHYKLHIAHGAFWQDEDGKSPAAFTVITHKNLVDGLWRPRKAALLEYCKWYTAELERLGHFNLVIWPDHCLIGSTGHAIKDNLFSAIQQWSGERQRDFVCINKGMNCFTEMYSAIAAEVPIDEAACAYLEGIGARSLDMEEDRQTTRAGNAHYVDKFLAGDRLLVCGQALSHCVNFTLRDIIKDRPAEELHKIVLLIDGSSPVTTFEELATTFVADMTAAGVSILTCSLASVAVVCVAASPSAATAVSVGAPSSSC